MKGGTHSNDSKVYNKLHFRLFTCQELFFNGKDDLQFLSLRIEIFATKLIEKHFRINLVFRKQETKPTTSFFARFPISANVDYKFTIPYIQKVPVCEIFDLLDSSDYYTIKSQG